MTQNQTNHKTHSRITYYYNDDRFFATLRERVNNYFTQTGLRKQDDPNMYAKTVVQLTAWLLVYGCIVSNYFHGLALFFLQIVFYFLVFLISVGIAHDGSHHAYSRRPWINKMMYRVFDLIGINSDMWEYNHNLSHHYVPNIPLYDSAIDSFGLFRFHPKAPYYKFHRYQHWYIFIIYALSTLFKIFFLDFFSFSRKRIGLQKIGDHSAKRIAYLIITKLIVISYSLVIPLLVIDEPAWHIIAGFLAGNFVAGITLGIVFQVTHLSDHSVFPEPDENGIIYNSFPKHIMQTTADFATNNPVVTWISGGLNIHVAHHLFPTISQVHLPALAKIVKATAHEFDVPYKEYPTVYAALKSHFRMLKKLGSKEYIAPGEWPIKAYHLHSRQASEVPVMAG